MNNSKIAFIGAGNIANAIISGLIANGYAAADIWASDPAPEKLIKLKKIWNINTTSDNKEAALNTQFIMLTVKPMHLPSVCHEIKDIVALQRPLIISTAVGATTSLLQRWLAGHYPIILSMPNICATIGAGATGLYANADTTPIQKSHVEAIFRTVGTTQWLEAESELAVVCALSGSGPAYWFYMMEAMQKAAINLGLSEQTAQLLTEQTALGAAKMALESGQPVSELRRAVTSPQGTTEAAINVLEHLQFTTHIKKALTAALHRHQEVTEILTHI